MTCPLSISNPAPAFDSDFDAFSLTYATSFDVTCDPLPLGNAVGKVVLMAPGSTIHHGDFCRRYVPRGIYMLFLRNQGAPANAIWVVFP